MYGMPRLSLPMILTVGVLLLGLSIGPRTAANDFLDLVGGGRIEGKVVKRTAEAIFVDVGYTIISVPVRSVKNIGKAVGDTGKLQTGKSRGDGEAGSSGNASKERLV